MSQPPQDDEATKIRRPTLPQAGETPTPSQILRGVPANATQTTEVSAAVNIEGTVLKGRYRLEKQVGAGGMGMVFKALDLEQQRIAGEEQLVAVKVLRPEFREHPDSMRALYEEVRKTRDLTHPNIVAVYDCQLDVNYIFMTMQYLEGKALQDLLDEEFARGMPWERARVVIEGMGRALAYAHDRGVIHCDLKPANVFVTLAGTPKILDFGIARATRGARKGRFDPGVLGALTSAYASPEMIRAWRTAEHEESPVVSAPDVRDDIFAFGCVIFELLTGQHPFGGRNAEEARQAGWVYRGVPGLSKRQNHTIAAALAFERTRRTASIEEVIDGLLGHPGTGKGLGIGAVVGIGALLVVVSGGLFLWVKPRSPPVAAATATNPPPLPDRQLQTVPPVVIPPAPAPPPPARTFKVGIQIHGLKGKGLVVANNGSDALEPSADGAATFGTALPGGAPYQVAVLASAAGQTCSPGTNATGTIAEAEVTIDINCSDLAIVDKPKPVAKVRHTVPPPIEQQPSEGPLRVVGVGMLTSLGVQNTYAGHCPKGVVFSGSIKKTGGAGAVRFAWVRSDGGKSYQQVEFGAGNAERQVQTEWTVSGRGEHQLWQQLVVLAPQGSANGPQGHIRVTCQN